MQISDEHQHVVNELCWLVQLSGKYTLQLLNIIGVVSVLAKWQMIPADGLTFTIWEQNKRVLLQVLLPPVISCLNEFNFCYYEKKKKGLPVFPKCCSIFRWIIWNIVMNILGDLHIVCHCSLSKHLFKTFAYMERWGLGGFWWTALILTLSFFFSLK